MGTNKGFTGQYADATGLDYYNARYYDPVIGRFLSADTVQGNGVGMDPYEYVGGNPETLVDPTGNKFVPAGGPEGDPGPPSCDDICQALKNLPGGSGCGKSCPGNGTQACDPQIGCHTRAVGQGTVYVKVEETHEVDVTTYSPVCYLVFCVSVPTVHKYYITTTHYVRVDVTFGVDVCLSGLVHGCGEEGGDDSDNTDDNHHTKPNVAASDDGAGDAAGGGDTSGTGRAKQLRDTNQVGKNRNIAIVDYNVGREVDSQWASSGPDVKGAVQTPTDPYFDATPTGKNLRDKDSEYKLLNWLAQRFNPARAFVSDIVGTVNLYTELEPCLSCSNVIEQFRGMFPNIELNVTFGPGN